MSSCLDTCMNRTPVSEEQRDIQGGRHERQHRYSPCGHISIHMHTHTHTSKQVIFFFPPLYPHALSGPFLQRAIMATLKKVAVDVSHKKAFSAGARAGGGQKWTLCINHQRIALREDKPFLHKPFGGEAGTSNGCSFSTP